MLARSLGVFASLALAVNSILLPPNVDIEPVQYGDLKITDFDLSKQTIAVECSTCPKVSKSGEASTGDAGTYYFMDFSVGPNKDSLLIDSFQLYPPVQSAFLPSITLKQVDSLEDFENALPVHVSAYLFYTKGAETIDEEGNELIRMTFEIKAIENQSVNPPAIEITVIKDSEGHIMILSLDTTDVLFSNPMTEAKECEEWPLLCKWKSIFADKIKGMKNAVGKGCGRFKGSHAEMGEPHTKLPGHLRPGFHRPPPHFGQDGPEGHRPHHHHGHHPHQHHGHRGSSGFLRRVFYTMLLPILVGIFAGTLTYLIGMALGYLIGVVITKVRGDGAYVSLSQDEEDQVGKDGGDSEKEVYAELPQYEAPPVYEEATEKEVVGETH